MSSKHALIALAGLVCVGIVLSVVLVSWPSSPEAALETALSELSSVEPPAGAKPTTLSVSGCADGDAAALSAMQDYTTSGATSDAQLDAHYLPKWRDVGWSDESDQPGVVWRIIDDRLVYGFVQRLSTPSRDDDSFSIVVDTESGDC